MNENDPDPHWISQSPGHASPSAEDFEKGHCYCIVDVPLKIHSYQLIINKGFSIATFDNQDTQETVIFPGPSYPFIILHPIRVGGWEPLHSLQIQFKSKRFGWYLKAINHGFRDCDWNPGWKKHVFFDTSIPAHTFPSGPKRATWMVKI